MKIIKTPKRKTKLKRNLFKHIIARREAKRHKYKNPHIHPRRLARAVAKANMQRAGWRKVNKHMASNWREMALQNRR